MKIRAGKLSGLHSDVFKILVTVTLSGDHVTDRSRYSRTNEPRPQPAILSHSYRMAFTGSRPAARRAGSQHAKTPTEAIIKATEQKMTGSERKPIEAITRACGNAAARPTARPTATCHRPRLITKSKILLTVAPSAIRTPISWVRLLVACAITA